MARRKKNKQKEEETLVDVVGRVETAQDYVEQNKNRIMTILTGLLLVIAAIVAYLYLYKAPRAKAADEMMQYAQQKFEAGQYAEALEGDSINIDHGFLDIIDNYSGTRPAKLAKYYAGICYLNFGNYDMAKSYLSESSVGGSKVLPSFKYAALGDANSELNDMAAALSNYKKAVSTNPNDYATPLHLLKLGLFQENQGDNDGAKGSYQRIKDEYPNSQQAADAEKYLARIGG